MRVGHLSDLLRFLHTIAAREHLQRLQFTVTICPEHIQQLPSRTASPAGAAQVRISSIEAQSLRSSRHEAVLEPLESRHHRGVGGCCAECCDRHNAQLTQLPALAQYIRELGIDVEIVKVDYTTGEHKTPEYLKV